MNEKLIEEIFTEIKAERKRQNEKWGEQNHPDGTGGKEYEALAALARKNCDSATRYNECTWRHILTEEFAEALAESDESKLKTELIQTAAVIFAWLEAIERRHGK